MTIEVHNVEITPDGKSYIVTCKNKCCRDWRETCDSHRLAHQEAHIHIIERQQQ